MTDPIPPRIDLKIAGARGESILDIVRRLGLGGAPSSASDTEAASFLALYTENQLASPPVYNSSTSFKIIGADLTRFYAVGKHVRVSGTATGTIYGTINTSAFTAGNTIVTVTWESGSLSNEAIAVSIIPGPSGHPINATDATYGAIGNGSANDSTAVQAAATAASGGEMFLPEGRYKLNSAVTLPANCVVTGEGHGTVILGNVGDYLKATAGGTIVLRNLTLEPLDNSYKVKFTGVTNFYAQNVKAIAFVDGTTGLVASGIFLEGVANAWIDKCYFLNVNNGIYLSDNAGTKCGTVRVTNCHFVHTLHGNFFSYPVGVYQYECEHLIVDACTFRDIFPGNLGNPAPFGYAVYEGDGSCKSTSVTNSHYITTENRSDTAMVLTSSSYAVHVDGNTMSCEHASGGGSLYRGTGGTDSVNVSNNIGIRANVIAVEGDSAGNVIISGNQFSNLNAQFAIRIGANSATIDQAIISDNMISGNVGGGGIFVNYGTWVKVSGNTIKGVNSGNTAYSAGVNEWIVSGIAFFGADAGQVSDNYISNGGGGHADFGIAVSNSTNSVLMVDNAIFSMDTAPTLNNTYLTGTATYDPASLADGAGATTTVAVTGAALGDFAAASFSIALQGILLTAWVSATDTVSVRFQNESGGTLDLGSGTLSARVMKKM